MQQAGVTPSLPSPQLCASSYSLSDSSELDPAPPLTKAPGNECPELRLRNALVPAWSVELDRTTFRYCRVQPELWARRVELCQVPAIMGYLLLLKHPLLDLLSANALDLPMDFDLTAAECDRARCKIVVQRRRVVERPLALSPASYHHAVVGQLGDRPHHRLELAL